MRIALPAICLVPCLVLMGTACGGSSSETPPPLEPDATLGRYTGPRLPGPDEDRAPVAAAAEPNAEELDPRVPSSPARSTWGSGKPMPAAPAPAMTSPNAAPAPSASPPL